MLLIEELKPLSGVKSLWVMVVVCTTSYLPSVAGVKGAPTSAVTQSWGGGWHVGRLGICGKLWFLPVTSCISSLQTLWTGAWQGEFVLSWLPWSASLRNNAAQSHGFLKSTLKSLLEVSLYFSFDKKLFLWVTKSWELQFMKETWVCSNDSISWEGSSITKNHDSIHHMEKSLSFDQARTHTLFCTESTLK